MRTVAILDSDGGALASTVAWFGEHAPGLEVTIAVPSWGELLTSERFPPSAVVLRPRAGDRVDIAYKARVCRILDIDVVVLSDAPQQDIRSGHRSVGATSVSSVEAAAEALRTTR
ncbi:hypothetical protein PlfCFBP13513_08805 [Plantibacter flavus]|uniref:hypothetical protein n=1 Tax=Plantibacter flavus TaxID=150123 RepID=UPI0010C21EA4|nr:hypothetical protein [Plantibacter flavus]TKJ99462.1 hypothetical protein PlfCFBP13513_08805 [Plantibacter flavus]